nr:hypothetical protein GCM10020241_09210 [Streptoalloteichus tenebrarius]
MCHGTLPLCHLGCGTFDLLVVNGPDHGAVWIDDRAAEYGIYPKTDSQGRVTFDRRYLEWLADAEATCARHASRARQQDCQDCR